MFGLGTQELIIILVIIMIIFGAGKLPQVGKSLGQGIRNFKDGIKEGEDEAERKRLESKSEEKRDV